MLKLSILIALSVNLLGIEFGEVLRDSRKWSEIDHDEVVLAHGEPDFRFGVSTCTYQDSGMHHCPKSQWATWERKTLPKSNRSGRGANFFELYQTPKGRKEIIKRLKILGVNSYRFSVEWSHIQPRPGIWDQKALDGYVDLCKHLRDEDIAPMVTLHHFSEPNWFHKRGSFEKRANIKHYVRFATRVFQTLTQEYDGKPLVDLFCTINEPNVEAFQRYVMGSYSPGKKRDFETAGHFLKHMLIAHCQAYAIMKPLCPEAQIGIVHQYMHLIPSNPLVKPITASLNRLAKDAPLHFFKTKGEFSLYIPMLCTICENFKNEIDVQTDFVGLQYYVRPVVSLSGSSSFYEPMTNTNMNFREDPEGIYEAIIETHKAYNAPIIITENGISTHDEEQRSRYMQRALYATTQARKVIGKENLRGYYCWSLPHVFEWDYGMRPEAFGLFELQDNGQLAVEPKPGTDSFVNVIKSWRSSLKK